MAEALGPRWIEGARELLLPMAAAGISDVLAEAMIKVKPRCFHDLWLQLLVKLIYCPSGTILIESACFIAN